MTPKHNRDGKIMQNAMSYYKNRDINIFKNNKK